MKSMGKKGVDWFLPVPIRLIVGALLLAIIAWLVISLFFSSSQGRTEHAASTSFDKLAGELESMLDSGNSFDYNGEFTYSLPSGYVLVGFDNDSSEVRVQSIRGYEHSVIKPDRCVGQACLCLYEKEPSEDEKKKDENIVTCKIFDGNIRFLGNMESSGSNPSDVKPAYWGDERTVDIAEGDNNDYEYLYIYRGYAEQGSFYIAKMYDGSQTYILITPLEKKFENHYQLFQKCPDNSDGPLGYEDLCDGVPYDSLVMDKEGNYYTCNYGEGTNYRCTADKLDECIENIEVNEPCVCGDGLVTVGEVCSEGSVYDVDCDEISSCEDYCDNPTLCVGEELTTCNKDPCRPEQDTCRIEQRGGRSSSVPICTS